MCIKLKVKDGELYFISEKLFKEVTKILKFKEIQNALERILIENMDLNSFAHFIERKLNLFLEEKLNNLNPSIKITEIQSSTPYLYTKLTISVRNLFKKNYLYKKIEESIMNVDYYHKHDDLKNCILHCFIKNCKDVKDEEIIEYESSIN